MSMTKREKRLERIRQNPSGWSIDELEQIMLDYEIKYVRSKGSHRRYTYILNGRKEQITVPVDKPIKPIYVKQVREVIEEIIANE
jgi:hypothetical protein